MPILGMQTRVQALHHPRGCKGLFGKTRPREKSCHQDSAYSDSSFDEYQGTVLDLLPKIVLLAAGFWAGG